MLDTIRTLESVIKILNVEKTEVKSSCLKCFPPINENNKQQNRLPADKWQTVTTRYHKQSSKSSKVKELKDSEFLSKNSFEVLRDLPSTVENSKNVSGDVVNNNNNRPIDVRVNVSQSYTRRRTRKKQQTSHRYQYVKPLTNTSRRQRLLICADSHGRDLAAKVNAYSKSLDAVGFVRPGGYAEEILNHKNIEGEKLENEDILVITCGSNDVARNQGENAIRVIDRTLQYFHSLKIVLVDFPIRYDLDVGSYVNKEILRSNATLDVLSKKYPNVILVKSSMAGRNLHTRHGMHLSQLGKHWLSRRICEVLKENTAPVSAPDHSLVSGCSSAAASTTQCTPRDTVQLIAESSSIEANLPSEPPNVESCSTEAKTIASTPSVARCLQEAEDQPPPPGTESPSGNFIPPRHPSYVLHHQQPLEVG
jgi:hypothetical protein